MCEIKSRWVCCVVVWFYTKVSSSDFLHFKLHLKLELLLLLLAVTIMLVFCGDWFGCGLLLLLRSRLLRFGVLLLLLVVVVSLLVADVAVVDFAAASNGFAVGIILLKLEKSNRYRIVHLSLSCACEKFMPAKWKPPMPPVQPINSRNTSFTLKLNLEWNKREIMQNWRIFSIVKNVRSSEFVQTFIEQK